MHKQLSDKLSALLTTAMREAIRSRRFDPARVPFKVHVAERAVNGDVFLGVSFPTLHPRAAIRQVFWNAVARLPFQFHSPRTWLDVPVVIPGAEHVTAYEVHAVLRALLGEERFGALTVEEVRLLLGTYTVEERERQEGDERWWRVTIPASHGRAHVLGGALYQSETAAFNAVAARCERLLVGIETFARVG
jgi:hypothetical protein